jgi:hypothetical protein
MNQAGAPVGNG